jgi:glycosyltransferase involved in cell wall biosynthesis
MRVAVVHEWFVDWAGSEKVVEQILTCYPSADLFSLVDFLPPEHRKKLLNKVATTTFLQRMPFARTHLHWYLPWMPFAIEQLDLSGYDLVISSSHAVAKGVITGPDQTHISYVHSPMRYAWDLQHDYLRGKAGRGLRGLALRRVLYKLRQWDSRSANGVDDLVANSQFVAKRIHKVYRREAQVIHPPIDIERFKLRENKDDFFLCAGRVMPYKRVDLVVKAFERLPMHKLVVIGDGPELRSIKANATKNVEFLGYQSDSVLQEYLQRARALIFAAKEDFGIIPLEAQACGTPVIAYGAGGVLETVTPLTQPNPTGLFFSEQSSEAIVAAVRDFERHSTEFAPQACREKANAFSPERFRREFTEFVNRRIGRSSTER